MISLDKIEDINLRSEILRQNLIQQLQDAKLPIVIIKYIMTDLTRQINDQFYAHCSGAGLNTSIQKETVEQISLQQSNQD